jgi:hypothetical protein
MEAIQSLFSTEVQIVLNNDNERFFSFLATKLHNGALRKALNSVSESKNQIFFLSFRILSSIPIKKIQNFTLVVNNTTFRTNLAYLCYISNVILAAFNQNLNFSSFTIEIPNQKEDELFNCISSFLNFLNGNSFSFTGFCAEVFFHVVDKLDIIDFESILLQSFPVPTQFKEALNFLQFKFASSLPTQFERSIQIMSFKFYKINLSNIPEFSIHIFESLLCSPNLKILNESFLLRIILKKTKIDSNYYSLLKYIHFSFVSSEILVNFLPLVDLINIDFSLFQNLKNGLTEFTLPVSQELTERWKEPPTILPQSEMKEIIQMLGDNCESKENVLKRFKGFVAQHTFYEELILVQNEETKLLKKKIHKQSQKFKNHFAQIDSKLDLILQTLGENNDSIHQEIKILRQEMKENNEGVSRNIKEEIRKEISVKKKNSQEILPIQKI